MNPSSLPRVSLDDLIDRHHTRLLDAYGVLLTHERPLPEAAAWPRRA